MLPGEVYYYAANSSVLCVQRDKLSQQGLHRKTPTSPRNLNPSAPAFRQGQAAPASPKNLNPTAPVFHQSAGGGGDKSPTDGSYSGADTTGQGLLTNGDIYANGTHYMVPLGGNGAVMHQGASSHPQGVHHVQSPQNGASMGLSGAPRPLLAAGTHSSHQAAVPTMSPHQQSVYAMAVQDSMGGQHAAQKQVRILSQSSPPAGGMNETGESSPIGAPVSVEEVPSENAAEEDVGLEGATGGQGYKYSDQVLAPITNQMQFYFSNENLPNDKFLNQHMDADKFIPLELFLDFGRIKPICNNIDQLIQAVESSSILELSEDRKKVRVSQCRKTLTLRGFPASATEEDVRQFILEMGACVPTHIEFVMYKEKYSVWYVSFKDEAAALNSFFQFHNKKAVYKDHNIGCCIKSSGTLAAAGYFPSSEESNQRRLAHQNPAAMAPTTAAVHVVQSSIPQPQPQQPQALMQPFSPMPLHSYMPSSPAGIYYQQTPQGAYMPYMAGMIQGWPNPAAALEPGLIMQNNGLQPQHIHTSMPRPHLLSSGSGVQHRYSRPPRARQNNLERSASERPSDRTPVVSVSGPSRSAPRSVEGAPSATLVPQGAYMPRRSAARDDITTQVMPQPQALSHTFVTPMVTQHQQQQHITPPATATAPPPSTTVNPLAIEPMAVSHYQAAPQPHPHQQPGPVLIQQQPMPSSATTSHPPPPPQQQTTSNPLPLPPPQLQMQHHHHHSQPPPAIQHQQQQQQPPHQAAANHQPQQQQGPPPHSSQHHMPPPPPPPQPPHHQHTPQMTHTHHPHQHAVVPHHHHAQQQQHHHTVPPPPPHHQQPLQNNRPERKGRRRREDNVRNPRSERNQSNRVNFGCQAPAAADNFTMEANSFPPLPGALSNIANSEISHENRMSDIVRGISRNSVGNSGAPRALSTTPSPVATPAPAPLTSGGAPLGQHHGITASALLDVHGLDDRDSPLDDDTTSSSQEEVDTDINSVESRSVRSEPQSVSSGAEQPAFPSQPRSQKATTPVTMSASSQKLAENRQGSYSMLQVQGLGSQQETPKPSYAQILALKNREAANNASAADNVSIGGLPPNSNSGTPNGPGSGHSNNSIATSGSGRAAAPTTTTQPSNAFREHGNYQGGPPQQQLNSRPSQRGPSKDLSRPDGSVQSTRPPNGNRRNSKENRTSNKFDRKKPETRQK